MSLSVPKYLQSAEIVDERLLYRWDEWNVRQYYDHDPLGLRERIAILSKRARYRATIAIGEWICHRFLRWSADQRPVQFLSCLGRHDQPQLRRYTETDDDEWAVQRVVLSI